MALNFSARTLAAVYPQRGSFDDHPVIWDSEGNEIPEGILDGVRLARLPSMI